jgi:hypothetical protein
VSAWNIRRRKGDRTTLAVMLGLHEAGYSFSVPFGENVRFDLVLIEKHRLARVQCKTGRLRNGAVVFATCSCYGHHRNPVAARRDYIGEVEYFAVYCHELSTVYLVPIADLETRIQAMLRVDPPRNNQWQRVRFARNYEIARVEVCATRPALIS